MSDAAQTMSPATAKDVVEVKDLRRYYETKGETVHALDGVSMSISEGEFLALAGPSGSGKSTMLNCMGALDRPTSGEIWVEGRQLSSMSEKDLSRLRRDRIGFVFQAYNLIPVMTVLENVEYVMMISGVPQVERHQRAAEILDRLGLDKKMLSRRPLELSGGQQQRVAVARAIVSQPAIVLADEPTANLDSTTSENLIDLMAELNCERGATFVFCTHDPRVMERASRLVHLRDGKIETDERR